MGKLAELAKAKKLKGKVAMTNLDTGETRTYEDEASAEAALPKGAEVSHRRGAFFYKGGKAEPEPVAADPDATGSWGGGKRKKPDKGA